MKNQDKPLPHPLYGKRKKRAVKRTEQLLSALRLSGRLSTDEIISMLGVSESTARRLCASLEEDGRLLRVYGGVTLTGGEENEYRYDRLEAASVEEKRRIGEAAASTVADDEIIYIDSGTTCADMCASLCERAVAGELHGTRIFTNSLVNFNILHVHMSVTLIGGEYRPHRRDFNGFLAEESLKLLNFNICFIGTDGYNETSGFTTTDFSTARLNKITAQRSKKCVVLSDSSKFGRVSVVSYATADEIDQIITDMSVTADTVELLNAHSVTVTKV